MVVGKFGLGRRAGLDRRAFTLVELLVVISIIGMLMALLLPAVQQAREAGRRNTCSNNMRNCALAVTNFASAKGAYPGYCDPLIVAPTSGGTNTTTSPAPPVTYPVSWIVSILPYLERTDIYTVWRNQLQWSIANGQGGKPPEIYMDILNCPSSPPPGTQGTAWCVYVANSGMMDTAVAASATYPADWQANGVFFNRFNNNPAILNLPVGAPAPSAATTTLVSNQSLLVSMSQDYITLHDGSSLTLMLSENNNVSSLGSSQGTAWGTNGLLLTGLTSNPSNWGNLTAGTEPQNCFVFWPDQQPHPAMKINSTFGSTQVNSPSSYSIDYNVHPSSNHPTVVNVSFCDGHTRTISQDIDYSVFCMLMTPYGQQTNTPGLTALDDLNNPQGNKGSNTVYYPSGVDNYYILRNRPVEEAQIN